ncbi:MAG: hypothetical protein HYS27_28700 [Deltaproteobacteria bacterium]|nr:hypothetical protein [Deltaproteobacteria bacterium]
MLLAMRPLALLLVALAAAPAAAEAPLAAAQRAYTAVEYGKCRDEAQRALEEPADRAARLDAWRLLGLCQAALGDTDAAREAFKRMLAVDWTAKLQDGLSPRFTSSFREAKGSFGGVAPLSLAVADQQVDGGTRIVKLKITDELELAHKVAWRGAAGSSASPVRAAPLLQLELPAEVDVTVTAYDKAAGEVAVLLVSAVEQEAPPPPPPDEVEQGGFPWLGVGIGAGVVLVAAAAAGGAAFVLLQPQVVTLKSDVAFGE